MIFCIISSFVVGYIVYRIIQQAIANISNKKNFVYQVDVFITPNIENIGNDVKQETKDKNKTVFYLKLWEKKEYKMWRTGDRGFFADDRLAKHYDSKSYIFEPKYHKDKPVKMPVRISQLRSRTGKLISSIDNINKEQWFNEKAKIFFNYCQLEPKEDNLITFLPFYLDCGKNIVMRIFEGGDAFDYYNEKLFEFPLNDIVRKMVKNFDALNSDPYFVQGENFSFPDYFYDEKFSASEMNDFAECNFDHRYGKITIMVHDIEIN